jgi:MFS family permease
MRGQAATKAVFRAYLLITGSAFAALGIQMVLFPYLVAVELHERPALIGLAQMAVMLPSLLFLLPAGALADRVNGKSFLSGYHLIASIPPLVLAWVLYAGGLSYAVIISYALLMGTLSAFALPVREAMVARVMPAISMQMAISAIVAAQFVTQIAGMGLVGLFNWAFPTGRTMIAEVMLVVQAIVFFGGVLAARTLPPNEPVTASRSGLAGRWREIHDGLIEAMTSPSIMPIIVAMLAVGTLYVGSFFTIIPVLIRDVYNGDAGTFSLVNVAFWSGTITANIAMMRRTALVHQGRAVAIALAGGAIVLALMSIPAPFWVLCALCFTWGIGAGVTITMGRTIVQEAAPPSHRGRIMSIYQFGFSGGAPFGALLLGLIVDAIGPYQTARIGPVIMIVVVAALCVGTGLLSIKSPPRPAESH